MAYLNAEEREQLANELINMPFRRAKHRVARMDRQGRLVYYRNNQRVNEWITRYDLEGLGARVLLIETRDVYEDDDPKVKVNVDYVLERVVVEPLPGNRT
jgi:hypothetical protein